MVSLFLFPIRFFISEFNSILDDPKEFFLLENLFVVSKTHWADSPWIGEGSVIKK